MSSRRATPAKTSIAAEPESWEQLYFPAVRALIGAGEVVMDELRRIASGRGLGSKPMAVAVWHLFQSTRMTAGELARRCGCDAGNCSGMLDSLERERLVERVGAPHDGRVRYVALTAKGRKIGAAVQADYKQSNVYKQLKRLRPRERASLTEVLKRIAESSQP